MDFSGLTDLKTTIPGILIIVGATVALIKGMCTFDRWWEIVLIVLAYIGGTKLMLAGKEKTP